MDYLLLVIPEVPTVASNLRNQSWLERVGFFFVDWFAGLGLPRPRS